MDTIANSTVSEASTEKWRDGKRYLWLIGLVVPSLAFAGYGLWLWTGIGAWFWIGPVVILVIVPVDRPDRRPGPLQPAGRCDRGAGEGQVLPLDHLPLPADPVRRLRRRDRTSSRAATRSARWRPLEHRQGRPGHLDRLHRRHRHQHRPRARPQARAERALALEDRARPELLRPLLHRAQPRPPRARRDPRGPGLARGWARPSTGSGRAPSAARSRAPGTWRRSATPGASSTRSGSATTCSTPG